MIYIHLYYVRIQNVSKENEELRKANDENMKKMEDTISKQDVIIKEMESNANMAKVEQEFKESKLSPGNKHEENLQQGNVCYLSVIFNAYIYKVTIYVCISFVL